MSKKVKVLISVMVAILLVAAATTATVMAQEEPESTPEAGGLLARVADILDIPQEELIDAFKQARQELRQEACLGALDMAVEKGLVSQDEADQIMGWWQQRPEAVQDLLPRVLWSPRLGGGHMQQQGILPMHGGPATPPWLAE